MVARARRAREIERTRQDILEAAARAFVHSGFKAATMQDIAKEAGYTAASLYSYFSSKEEIFKGLHELVMDELSETLAGVLPEGLSFRQRLELVIQRQIEFASRRQDLFALLHRGGPVGDAQCALQGEAILDRRVALLTEFLEQNSTEEERGGRTARETALLLFGFSFAFFFERMRAGRVEELQEQLPRLLDLLFYGLQGPPPETPPPADR